MLASRSGSIDCSPSRLHCSIQSCPNFGFDRKVVVFRNDDTNAALAAAQSIVAQSIYSALCAPLIAGETVLGVLYIDFQLSRGSINEEDAQLAAQIARVAAIKLESTRLREAALEKGKLDEAFKLARSIQMRMLPQKLPLPAPGALFDVAAAIRPAIEVGGDFYDFHATADSKVYVCIGDVPGKGIPAALMMAVSRALLRSLTLSGLEPAAILGAVNRQLCDESDPSMFVTAFCALLDLATGELRYANAGHNPPLIASAGGSVRMLETRPGIVLACLPKFQYAQESTTLARGDILYLYANGISEAADRKEEMFGMERLKETVGRIAANGSHAIATATLANVDAFVGDAPQSDDLTLLCLRYSG